MVVINEFWGFFVYFRYKYFFNMQTFSLMIWFLILLIVHLEGQKFLILIKSSWSIFFMDHFLLSYQAAFAKLSHWGFLYNVLCSVTQSCPTLCDPWTAALQAPLSMGICQARILEWGAMPSSRGSSQSRDQTQDSCISGRFFTSWAIREAQKYHSLMFIFMSMIHVRYFLYMIQGVGLRSF